MLFRHVIPSRQDKPRSLGLDLSPWNSILLPSGWSHTARVPPDQSLANRSIVKSTGKPSQIFRPYWNYWHFPVGHTVCIHDGDVAKYSVSKEGVDEYLEETVVKIFVLMDISIKNSDTFFLKLCTFFVPFSSACMLTMRNYYVHNKHILHVDLS